MFMQIAIAAVGLGIVVMIGYILLAETRNALPTIYESNPCYQVPNNNSTSNPECFGSDNTSQEIADTNYSEGLENTQDVAFSGLSLVAIGIIVLAAFGLIAVFNK